MWSIFGQAFKCYASKDLMTWEFRNNILTIESVVEAIGLEGDTQLSLDGNKINIEHPKVIYNAKTKKYVMWAYYEDGISYKKAAVALASCDTPDGDFVYHGFFRPFGHMSRDCNVFEQDGNMYFISAANDNQDLNIYLLKDDYLGVEKMVNTLFVGQYREAPALFNVENGIYIINSGCLGWKPNQGKYSFCDRIDGIWDSLEEMGDAITYQTQPTAVLMLKVNGVKQYMYIGDRWGGSEWNIDDACAFEYEKSTYYFSLLEVDGCGKLTLLPCDNFTINLKDGGFRLL